MGRRYKVTEKPSLKNISYACLIHNVHGLVGPTTAKQWDKWRWLDWAEVFDEWAGQQGITKDDMY